MNSNCYSTSMVILCAVLHVQNTAFQVAITTLQGIVGACGY